VATIASDIAPGIIAELMKPQRDNSVREKTLGYTLSDSVIDKFIAEAKERICIFNNGEIPAEIKNDPKYAVYAGLMNFLKKTINELPDEVFEKILNDDSVSPTDEIRKAFTRANLKQMMEPGSNFSIWMIQPKDEIEGLPVPWLAVGDHESHRGYNFGHYSPEAKNNRAYIPKGAIDRLLQNGVADNIIIADPIHELAECMIINQAFAHMQGPIEHLDNTTARAAHFIAQLLEIEVSGQSDRLNDPLIGPVSRLEDELDKLIEEYKGQYRRASIKIRAAEAEGGRAEPLPPTIGDIRRMIKDRAYYLSLDRSRKSLPPDELADTVQAEREMFAKYKNLIMALEGKPIPSEILDTLPPGNYGWANRKKMEQAQAVLIERLEEPSGSIRNTIYREVPLRGGLWLPEIFLEFPKMMRAIATLDTERQLVVIDMVEHFLLFCAVSRDDKDMYHYDMDPLNVRDLSYSLEPGVLATIEMSLNIYEINFDLQLLFAFLIRLYDKELTICRKARLHNTHKILRECDFREIMRYLLILGKFDVELEDLLEGSDKPRWGSETATVPSGIWFKHAFVSRGNIEVRDGVIKNLFEKSIWTRDLFVRGFFKERSSPSMEEWLYRSKVFFKRMNMGTSAAVGAIRANGGPVSAQEHGARLKGHSVYARKMLELTRREGTINGAIAKQFEAHKAYAISLKGNKLPFEAGPYFDAGKDREYLKGELEKLGINFIVVSGLKGLLPESAKDLVFHYGVTRKSVYIDEDDFNYLFNLPNGADIIIEGAKHEKAHIDNELANLENPEIKLLSEGEIEKLAPSVNVRAAMLEKPGIVMAEKTKRALKDLVQIDRSKKDDKQIVNVPWFIRAWAEVQGLLFWPKTYFTQELPLDKSSIISRIPNPENAAERALGLLKKAKESGKTLAIFGHLRGIDGPGSSLDLPEFQRKLTNQNVASLEELPSTLTLASEFGVTIEFEPIEFAPGTPESEKDVIEYMAPDYFKGDTTARRIKGGVKMSPASSDNPWETTSQANAPAYIFRNLFGLKGVRIICKPVHPMALAGGMESSNVFNVALISAASMLSGANLSQAEIFNLAVKLENNEFKGLTGGQGHLCSMVGGAYRHVWLSGIRDEAGNLTNPYSALAIPLLNENQIIDVENHTFLVQAGKDYEKGVPAETRSASLINYMWTDLLRYEDKVGLELHSRKLKLAAEYAKALQEGNFDIVASTINQYVDIRDQLCRRWMELVVGHHLGRQVPGYVTEHFVDKVVNPENQWYEFYAPVRKALAHMDEVLAAAQTRSIIESIEEETKNISFYTLGPIGELIKAARAEGIAIMPLGAGGPGANLIAVSSKGNAHMAQFFEKKGIERFTEEKARQAKEIIYGEKEKGTLKGYIPFKVGREPLKITGFNELKDVQLPAAGVTQEAAVAKFEQLPEVVQPRPAEATRAEPQEVFDYTIESIMRSSNTGERARKTAEAVFAKAQPAANAVKKHLIFVKSAIPSEQLATTTAINYATFCADYYNELEGYTADIVDNYEEAIKLLAKNRDWDKTNTIVGLIDKESLDNMTAALKDSKMEDKTKLLPMERFDKDQFVPLKGFFDLMSVLVQVNRPLDRPEDQELRDAIRDLLNQIGVRDVNNLMDALSASAYFEDPIKFAKNFIIRLLPPTRAASPAELRERYNAAKKVVESL
jgi:galactokinase/mevalonate kinase-like predicted kinase